MYVYRERNGNAHDEIDCILLYQRLGDGTIHSIPVAVMLPDGRAIATACLEHQKVYQVGGELHSKQHFAEAQQALTLLFWHMVNETYTEEEINKIASEVPERNRVFDLWKRDACKRDQICIHTCLEIKLSDENATRR